MTTTRLPLLFLIPLLLFNCGGNDGEKDDSKSITFKKQDNAVYARLPAEPDRLNPVIATNLYARVINEQLFLSLLQFNPRSLKLDPQLAVARPKIEELETGPYAGGVSYTFEIQPEAVWDNGQPILASDFVFTLKALLNPKVPAAHVRPYLDFVQQVEIDSENPKRFTVFTDGKYIIGETVVSNIPVLPEYAYDPEQRLQAFAFSDLADADRAAELAEQEPALQAFAEDFSSSERSREKEGVVGSGPYAFVSWETGQRIVLERKQDWWGDELSDDFPLLTAQPERLEFRIIPDQTASLAALKDEQVDVMTQIDAKDFADLQDNTMVTDRFALHAPPSFIYYYIGMNNKAPKLADRRVRRALAHLVDVEELIEKEYYGLAQRTVGPFHPTKPYYHDGLKPIEFSAEKARALLTEAGWEDSDGDGVVDKVMEGENVPLELEFKYSNASDFARRQALLFQNAAQQAGVKINLTQLEFTVLISDTKKRDYEMYSSAWGQDPIVDDPKQLWHSESDTPSGGNRVSFVNAKADRLIEEIRVTLDEEKRNELYLEFQELIYKEQPYIFLFSPLQRIAISKRFEAEPSARRPGFFVNEFVKRDLAPK